LKPTDLTDLLGRLLRPALEHASPGRARPHLPGSDRAP